MNCARCKTKLELFIGCSDVDNTITIIRIMFICPNLPIWNDFLDWFGLGHAVVEIIP